MLAQAKQVLKQHTSPGQGFDGEITLIGAENVLPYQRPPLSKKYVIGDMRKERLYLKPESFYHENQIKLRLGLTVKKINRSKKRIETDSVTYDYDQLILTTGSLPNQFQETLRKTYPGYTIFEILMMQTNSKRYLNQVRLP